MSRAQRILAVIVGLITGVLLVESYGAMVTAARAGARAIPELWPLGTEALALAMEVSVLEAKRLGHRAVLRLSWLLLVASVALSTMLQVAVAPPTLVGYVTAGATPVWLLGSFAVLSLLYRADISATQATTAAEPSAERSSHSADPAPSSVNGQRPGAEVLSKRARAERLYAELSANGAPPPAPSWPWRLGSAAATLAPWSPSSRLNRQPPFSTTAAPLPRRPWPNYGRRPPHDGHATGRPRRRQPPDQESGGCRGVQPPGDTGQLDRPGTRGAVAASMPQSQARWDGRARRLLDQAAAEGGITHPARSAACLDRA